MQMRDGVELSTRVWKPEGQGPFPVILERGYDPGIDWHAERFAGAGYAYVGQQCRGNLEGGMFRTDHVDGYDCMDWIVAQPWCNGDIAMYGRSFMGATQILTAPEHHPNLRAIVPQVINPSIWERGYWDHGALQLSHVARRIYRTKVADDMTHKVDEFGGWDTFYRHLPLITLDTTVVGKRNNLWQEYVSHSEYGPYWSEISTHEKLDRINVPTYIHAGWYDNYPSALLKAFQVISDAGNVDELRIHVGPTDHMGDVVGDRPFGDHAFQLQLDLALRWLDYVVKGEDNGVAGEPPITVFTMGVNEWRTANTWPPENAVLTKFYLHSDGSRHGTLSVEAPGDEPASEYDYDPDDPVPTLGGNHSGPQDHPEVIRVGALDQRPNWDRPDVLVFETPELAEDTEVTGPISATIFASTSALDTDFIVRLLDVEPDGTAYNLTDGIIRTRFRKSIYEPPELLAPGEVFPYEIELLPTSNVFLTGHRIAVHVTSSCFPLYDRNPNTGHEQGMDSELQVAHQTIFHDSTRPSHITLPVVR
ncbi:MAG: CocE/NonD family hydrolase [Chloroflexi bacterium]|nr:CocE/NonD family hydrolase [Chloroflexota bacterium]